MLILIALVFFLESMLFFVNALSNAGVRQTAGIRFLVLTIGTFVTAVAAAHGFGRRVRQPGAEALGLLLVQPLVDAAAKFLGGDIRAEWGTPIVAAVAGIAVLLYVVVENRRSAPAV